MEEVCYNIEGRGDLWIIGWSREEGLETSRREDIDNSYFTQLLLQSFVI